MLYRRPSTRCRFSDLGSVYRMHNRPISREFTHKMAVASMQPSTAKTLNPHTLAADCSISAHANLDYISLPYRVPHQQIKDMLARLLLWPTSVTNSLDSYSCSTAINPASLKSALFAKESAWQSYPKITNNRAEATLRMSKVEGRQEETCHYSERKEGCEAVQEGIQGFPGQRQDTLNLTGLTGMSTREGHCIQARLRRAPRLGVGRY